MDAQVLGSYDPEQVTMAFTGIKSGVEIVPTQFGPETRITISERQRSEVVEGQGGTVIVSRLHTTLAVMELSLMPTDPAVKEFAKGADTGEIYTFQVTDNSGVDQKVTGKAVAVNMPAWNKNRVAEPVSISMNVQIQRDAMQHGQTAIV
jgi:hypothetical protein